MINLPVLKKMLLAILLISFLLFFGCHSNNNDLDNEKPTVVVSIAPEAGFVEAVAGNLVNIITVVPPGNSPANYQPNALDMQMISDGDIYFLMQVPTEEANILPKIYDFNENIYIINLRKETEKEYPLRYIDDNSMSVDPHIWLSPKRVMVIVKTIADKLSELDPENMETYKNNAKSYIDRLKELDISIRESVNKMDKKAFMIYHGAYGYFADDYGLQMISIEADGKAATPSDIQDVIDYAIENDIKIIFYQEEFDDVQAQVIATEIGGKVVKASPLSKDYLLALTDFTIALENDGE